MSGGERDVARFAAERLSNREIAARLHLSVGTVESHVGRERIREPVHMR
jgi:DNA-binding CsgD family transcriptional regulator